MRTSVRPVAARVNASPDLLDWVRGLVSLVFVLLVPMLIIGTSLRGLVTDRDLMLRGFRDNQVATTTGLDDPQLQRIADAFVAYLQGPPGQIQMQVTAFGQARPLFNAKEVTHMEDVQRLIQFFLQMQLVAAAAVVLRVVVAFASDRASAPIGRSTIFRSSLEYPWALCSISLSLWDRAGVRVASTGRGSRLLIHDRQGRSATSSRLSS